MKTLEKIKGEAYRELKGAKGSNGLFDLTPPLVVVSGRMSQATKPLTDLQRLDRYGVRNVCNLIENGVAIVEICRIVGVHRSELYEFLARPEHTEMHRRARLKSAEAWVDRSLTTLLDAPDDSQAALVKAKAIADHCKFRAALYDPTRYSERLNVSQELNITPLAQAFQALQEAGSAITVGSGRIIDGDARKTPSDAPAAHAELPAPCELAPPCVLCAGHGLPDPCPLCGTIAAPVPVAPGVPLGR